MPHALVNVLQQSLREYSWRQGTLMAAAALCSREGILRVGSWPKVRAMRFYTLVPRFSADPLTDSATIRWGLPRTGRRQFLAARRVRQKVLESAGCSWLDRVPLSLFKFHGVHLLWCSCDLFKCPSNLSTGTRHWCLEFGDIISAL